MKNVLAVAALLLCTALTAPAPAGTFSVQSVTNPPAPAFSVFGKYVDVWGVSIYATSDISDAKVLHAAAVLAQYLDNDEDGTVDSKAVYDAMIANSAILIMFGDDNAHESSGFEENLGDAFFDSHVMQLLYGFETLPQGPGPAAYDGTLEEVLHLVTDAGWVKAFPSVFGLKQGTPIALAMEEAATGNYYNPEANEPGLDYETKITEYLYWALTSILGSQDYAGRLDEIGEEWSLNTKALVQQSNPAGYALLTTTGYGLPTVIPDGDYSASGTPNPPIPPTTGNDFTGWWYTPAEPGSGLSMQAQNDILFLVWYVYGAPEDDGPAEWLVSWAPKQPDGSYAGDLQWFDGPALNADWTGPTAETIGSVGVSFTDDDHGIFTYTIDDDITGSKSIQRYMPDLVPGVESDTRGPDGWWVVPSMPGMGVFTEVRGETLYLGWYHYRENNSPVWRTLGGWKDVGGFPAGTTTYTADLQEYKNGWMPGEAWSQAELLPSPGKATLTVVGNGASLLLSFNGEDYPLQPYLFTAVP